jgi:2-polyprenyl-6-methoxyphenol hydroxylase-like FAD-dependent oxidoreductase
MARSAKGGSLPHLKRSITISGGGLAGLSLAIGLRHAGVPVVVHEAGAYPRHRVCGEFISGVSQETLERLGVAADLADARLHHSVAWHEGGHWMRRDSLAEPARGISRWRLDERLVRRLETLGGSVILGAREKPLAGQGRVWAAGRRPRRGGWLGLKCHFYDVPMGADLEMHLGHGGYVGLAGVEDNRVNVCGLFRVNREVKGTGSDLLTAYLRHGKLWQLAENLAQLGRDESSFSAVSGFALGRQAALPGLAAIGDAQSMIPPFTGNGMSMAFESADTALGPLVAYAEDHQSWDECLEAIRLGLRRRFRRRLAAAGLMHPFLIASAGRRVLGLAARSGLLPFQTLMGLVR